MIDLINEMNGLSAKLTIAGRQMEKHGRELAEAEKDYRIALRSEWLKEEEKGSTATKLNKTIYGSPEVADKRFKRDIAETMYKTSIENINMLKLKIRILDSQIQREWHSNG